MYIVSGIRESGFSFLRSIPIPMEKDHGDLLSIFHAIETLNKHSNTFAGLILAKHRASEQYIECITEMWFNSATICKFTIPIVNAGKFTIFF